MKKALVIFFVLIGLMNISLLAQNDTIAPSKSPAKSSRGFIGAGLSFPFGTVIAGGARNGFGVSLSLNGVQQVAKNRPYDYDGGNNLLGDGSDNIEKDRRRILSLRVTKQFGAKSKRIHWGIEAGPSFGRSTIADHFIPVLNPCSVDPFFGLTFCKANYTYKMVNSTSTGLSLKAKMGVEIFEDVLFELGGFYNRNAEWTFFGVDLVGSLGIF